MKIKILPILLSMLIILTVSSCNNPSLQNVDTTEKDTPTETPTEEKDTTVADTTIEDTTIDNTTTPEEVETTAPDNTDTTAPDDTDTTVPDDTNTTVPDATDTTVPDDTDTTQPPDISDDPPVELAERVQSVEITNGEEVVVITLGMADEECNSLLPEPRKTMRADRFIYRYCVNTQNQNVVLKISNKEQTVSEIWVFPEKNSAPTHDDFYALEPGMTLEEIVFALGIPDLFTNNMVAVYYKIDSQYYMLVFEDSENGEVLVTCYYPPEDET